MSDLRPSCSSEPYCGRRIIRTRSSASAPSLLPQVVWVGRQYGSRYIERVQAYLAQGEQSPELDQPMEIAKANVHRNEDDIDRVAEEVPPELDCLTEQEGPAEQKDEERLPLVFCPIEGCVKPSEEDEDVVR